MLPQIFLNTFLLLLTMLTLTEEERIITTIKYSAFRVKPTIVHGNPATTGQIPFLVSIKEPVRKINNNQKLWRNLCGGSIISPMKVLTAAHCFEAKNFYYAKNFEKLRVVAGNLQNELVHSENTSTTEKGGQWRSITKVTLHREFQFPSHDIALVIIDSEFIFTKTVNYVIPAKAMTDYPSTCIAAGFGETWKGKSAKVSQQLRWADIVLLSRRQCDVWWEMNMDTFVCTTSQLTDVGGGDSGGPLACYGTLDPSEKKGRDLLVGVVSGKNFDKTTLFTRVSAYKDWLKRDAGHLCESSKLFISVCFVITLFYICLLILLIFMSLYR